MVTSGFRLGWLTLLSAVVSVVPCGPVSAQDSPHGPLSFACEDCHVPDSWKVMPVPAKFDHRKTKFALKGQHDQVKCMDCHTSLTFKFAKSSSRCADCHQDVHRGELGATCDRCHSPQAWLVPDMIQKHASTSFPLVGAHATVPCQQCHASQEKHEFVGLRTDCFGCHQQDFATANGVTPAHAGFGTDCQSCHALNAMNWGVIGVNFTGNFDHAKTGFPLAGAHASLACAQCHPGNVFKAASTQCISCHSADFTTAVAPPHTGFSNDCTTCHTLTAWQPATFNHTTGTTFPLTGAHASAAVACQQCHVNNVFKGLSTTCYGCHQAQFTTANAPPHTGFSTDCTTCHTNTAWQPATFNHTTGTTFPLTGGHTNPAIACQQCHVNNVYKGLSTACYSCHQQDFTNALAPVKHTGFATDCSTCHTTNPGWTPSTFNHSTVFALVGAHTTLPCAQCHVNNQYAGLATTCYGCHQAQFTTANAPPHTGFSQNCSTCHSNTAWQPATFNHTTNTTFPLTGAHTNAAITCQQCHVNNVYAGLSTQCYSCHQQDFTNALTPVKHTGFATDCSTCHTTNPGWTPSTFNHTTVFALVGAHTTLPCAQCHVNNQYVGLATTCYGCHQSDYTTANAPPHTGFPQDCTTCHSNAAWQPATFNHTTNTSFPLTGAHTNAAITCQQCHVNNVYAGLSTACYSCHQQQFTSALSPVNHTGFATDCTPCHTTNPGWTPSIFDHNTSTFPLTGAHPAVACAQCHVNSQYVGVPVTCYGCHQSQFTTANAPPHAGFPQDCTTCHTTSAWQPATFNHANTPFPLTGAHTTVACASCHVNNVYAGLTHDCYTCHTSTFTSATTPVPHTGFPTASCATCHTTNAGWAPSTYSHANATPRFPQDSRHTTAACAKCHQTATNYTVACCQSSGCHNTCAGAN